MLSPGDEQLTAATVTFPFPLTVVLFPGHSAGAATEAEQKCPRGHTKGRAVRAGQKVPAGQGRVMSRTPSLMFTSDGPGRVTPLVLTLSNRIDDPAAAADTVAELLLSLCPHALSLT